MIKLPKLNILVRSTKWSKQTEYPYKVDVYNITYRKWLTIDKWCHDRKMNYTTDYTDWDRILDSWWTFKNEEDATLFKLTWLG